MEHATATCLNAWRARARETQTRTRTNPRTPPPSLALRAMAVEFPQVHGHPNRLPFEGVLTLIDIPSDKAPSGARGHRVLLTRAAAEAALPSLLGMAVDYKAAQPGAPGSGWDGHDARQKCGIITAAEIDGRRLTVAGYLFARDFPEIAERLASDAASRATCHPERAERVEGMGMSYELADAHVADMSAPIWTLTRATFTGAAILLRDKAAYRNTSFQLGVTTNPGAPCSTRVSRVDHGNSRPPSPGGPSLKPGGPSTKPGGPSFAASSQRVGCRSPRTLNLEPRTSEKK